MFRKPFSLLLTILNLLVCLSVSAWVLGDAQPVQAQPGPFLRQIYAGRAPVTAIFDHRYPLISQGGDDDCGNAENQPIQVLHYDNSNGNALGYDGHDGIDYDLNYQPVLAAAVGVVNEAGWSNPQDHTAGLGLRVVINHPDHGSYKTIYGHMSVVHVQTGENVYPIIIGISGNTGNSDGSHLHFEVRNASYRPVNPYGWQSGVADPWSTWNRNDHTNCNVAHPAGATSVNLWLTYPALLQNGTLPLQYPSGAPITINLQNITEKVIDNSDPAFSTAAGWYEKSPAEDGYLGNYRYGGVVTTGYGYPATWNISGLSTTRSYYVFAHIPLPTVVDPPPSVFPAHYALYTIHHNGQTDQAIVAQSQFPNGVINDGWVLLGAYYFSNSGTQYVQVSRLSEAHSSGRHVLADAIKLAYSPSPTGCPLGIEPTAPAYTWDALGDGNGRIKITWSGFDDSSLDGFDIYRHTTPDINNATLVHEYEEAASGDWIDTGVANGIVYYYWLNIFDCYGQVTLDGPRSTTTGYQPDPCGCGSDARAICPDVICPNE